LITGSRRVKVVKPTSTIRTMVTVAVRTSPALSSKVMSSPEKFCARTLSC